jgi:hypothetical protein
MVCNRPSSARRSFGWLGMDAARAAEASDGPECRGFELSKLQTVWNGAVLS